MSLACAQVASTMFYFPDMAAADPGVIEGAEYLVRGEVVSKVDPYARIAGAANGDIDAMRGTADAILLWVLGKNDPTPVATLREGLVFARMAASRGATEDITRLIYMLSYAGMICAPDELEGFAAEMIAMVEILADLGNEDCATLLASVAEHETTATMLAAKEMKERIGRAWGI